MCEMSCEIPIIQIDIKSQKLCEALKTHWLKETTSHCPRTVCSHETRWSEGDTKQMEGISCCSLFYQGSYVGVLRVVRERLSPHTLCEVVYLSWHGCQRLSWQEDLSVPTAMLQNEWMRKRGSLSLDSTPASFKGQYILINILIHSEQEHMYT